MDYYKKALDIHKKYGGKIKIAPKMNIRSKEDLSLIYTPGVAGVSLEIDNKPSTIYDYTLKSNTVAIISDGSAVLGLGNIGAKAAVPVMEGKAALFKRFANIDAFPICIKTNDTDKIIETVSLISTVFGGINLEDISAPRCFEIERRLDDLLDIPVFHDDQHGTAIVVSAALINALKLTGKQLVDIKVTVCGAGAAGTAIVKNLSDLGCKNIIVCDKTGILSPCDKRNNSYINEVLKTLTPHNIKGGVKEAVDGCDVFIGVSTANVLNRQMVKTMNDNPIVFALANPNPEIDPDEAKAGGALIVGTGRSDYPNQINNLLAFPGIFRGALNAKASSITKTMKIAATYALASCVPQSKLSLDNIIPSVFDDNVVKKISHAVEKSANNS